MPTPEMPRKMTDIPGFPSEKAEQLEATPELKRVLFIQEEDTNQLVFILEKSTISIPLDECLIDIGNAIKQEQADFRWCHIPDEYARWYESLCQRSGAKITCLFPRESFLQRVKSRILEIIPF